MTLRLGVIGTGRIGRDHMRRCVETVRGAEIVAASDLDRRTARDALDGAALPDAVAHDDGEALIADGRVDAVLVTSPGPAHERAVLAAIAAGKPVFCEKPLAPTAEACLRIAEAEAAGGRRLLQVGFMRLFDRGHRALRDAVRAGTVGDVLMVHAHHRNQAAPPGFTTAMLVNDTLVHELDALRHILDDEYRNVRIVFPPPSPHAAPALRDPQIALLETARGTRIDVEIFVNARYGYDIGCEIVGTEGTIALPPPEAAALRRDAATRHAVPTDWTERFRDAYDREIAAFVRGALAGRVEGPGAWDGLAAAIASDAALRSQETGETVPIAMPARPEFHRA